MSHEPRPGPSLSLPLIGTLDAEEPYQPYGLETYYGEVMNTLTFRLKDGNRFAKPYHLLSEFEYDPSTGIRLIYSDSVVHLTGRNLEPLFTLVCEFRVRWIWEADRPTTLQAASTAILVDGIERTLTTVRK